MKNIFQKKSVYRNCIVIALGSNPKGKINNMPALVEEKPRDCLGCRLISSAGLVGIGGYLANLAWKNKTFAGRVVISTLSLTFVSFGVARYKQQYPFDGKKNHK